MACNSSEAASADSFDARAHENYEVPLVSNLSMFVNNISMFTANPDRKSHV